MHVAFKLETPVTSQKPLGGKNPLDFRDEDDEDHL